MMNWLIIILCFIWGSNWVAMKAAMDYFPPVMFSAIRFLLGAVVLFLILFYKRTPFPNRYKLKWYAVCGFLQTAFMYAISQSSVLYINAGIACVLGFTMPFWLSIMAHFILPGERLTPVKMAGLMIGMIGLFFVMNINPFLMQLDRLTVFVELLVVLSSLAWAIANLIIKTKLQNCDMVEFTAYQMGFGGMMLFVFALFYESGQPIEWTSPAVFALIYAGVLASSLAYVLWFFILSRVGASKSSVSLLLVPVIGALSVWIVLGEQLEWVSWFGILLVVLGIGFVNRKEKTVELKIDRQSDIAS